MLKKKGFTESFKMVKPLGRVWNFFINRFLPIPLFFSFVAMSFLASTAPAQTINTCAQYQTVNTTGSPGYYVQTNYWNKGNSNCSPASTTQCMNIDLATGNFAVTAGNFQCGDTVANYPSIVYGCQYGASCSPGTNLPMAVSLLTCVTSSWNIGVTNLTGNDLWDAAYDIWFSSTSANTSHTAELMIWMNYMPGTQPTGSWTAGNVQIGAYTGTNWEIYEGIAGGGSVTWNCISFLADKNVTSFNDVDILAFIQYCETQGFIQPSWYLGAIEAGIEMRTGGVPFTSTGFQASVNGASCGTPTTTPSLTPTITSTPTSTPVPCGYPGNTCTPTPTVVPSSVSVPYPNPWPDKDNPNAPLQFNYTNSQQEDQVSLKIYTVAFRKVFEDDGLSTVPGYQPPYVMDWSKVNGTLANGLYYFVIETKQGSNLDRKIMKVLIRR